VPHEIISVRRWVARNVVSDAYRNGRVFFAGDAAHLNHHPPGLVSTPAWVTPSISVGSWPQPWPAGAARNSFGSYETSASRSGAATSATPM